MPPSNLDVTAQPGEWDEAIEAAAKASTDHVVHMPPGHRRWTCACGASGTDCSPWGEAHRHLVGVQVRAAAPVIAAATLNKAADRIQGHSALVETGVVEWLRERAKEAGG